MNFLKELSWRKLDFVEREGFGVSQCYRHLKVRRVIFRPSYCVEGKKLAYKPFNAQILRSSNGCVFYLKERNVIWMIALLEYYSY